MCDFSPLAATGAPVHLKERSERVTPMNKVEEPGSFILQGNSYMAHRKGSNSDRTKDTQFKQTVAVSIRTGLLVKLWIGMRVWTS